MRVLLLDHGCRAGAAPCLHPDATRLAADGARITVTTAAEFASATTGLSEERIGDVRETARRAIDRAVDAAEPDVILVLHAGMLVDLAIETGVPVAVHVTNGDLASAGEGERIRELVASALSSADVVAADSASTAAALVSDGWVDFEVVDVFELDDIARLLAACRRAIDRRRG